MRSSRKCTACCFDSAKSVYAKELPGSVRTPQTTIASPSQSPGTDERISTRFTVASYDAIWLSDQNETKPVSFNRAGQILKSHENCDCCRKYKYWILPPLRPEESNAGTA
jgi:hypothetical protein